MSPRVGYALVVIATIVVCLSVTIRGSVEAEFYPFGADSGDNALPPGNDGISPELSLSTPFVFYGNSRETLFVNNNGLLSFGGPVAQFNPSPFPLQGLEVIAPYWADVDTRGSGTVFYRETNDADLLARIANCLQESYPGLNSTGTLNPTLLFIVTWDNVGYFDQNSDRTNTFQCLLVIDGERSFAVFLYAEIQWTTGDASGGENGLGGTPANAGINAGDGTRHFSVPGALSDAIINITNTSNIGMPGVWVFRTDGDSISQPGAIPSDCGINLDQCDQNAQCLNMPAERFGCFCNAGFSGNGTICTDIDECSLMAEGDTRVELPCEQICINLPGSFTCGCNEGYVLAADGTSCDKIAGCETAGFTSCCTEACFVQQGTCYCDQSCYEFGDCCDDIRNICQPEDPCTPGFHNCSDDATCIDTEVGFTCTCNPGFTGNGTICSDIDECTSRNANCSSDAVCINVVGSFVCNCNVGYTGDGLSCTDIDECSGPESEAASEGNATNGTPCDQICTNVPGSFQCDCEEGYQLSTDGHTCNDVNECNNTSGGSFNSSSPCEQICINMPGSFQCACNENFALVSDGSSCVQITNCSSAGFDGCCEVADCSIELEDCFCDESCYEFDDCCEDISETCPPDECRLGLANCDVNAMCTDTEEGFTCTCNPGYNGTGIACSDINECDSMPCDQNCNNTPGSFFCSCIENFVLVNRSSCIRDVCGTEAANNCSLNAQCNNVDSEIGFVCTCNPGYTGNGFTCTDVNECVSEESNLCQQNCINTIGSFQCACGEEFVLSSDGTNCLATGCVSAGFTGCCSGQCLVEADSCFCDPTCYDFDDCCADIEQTCPPGSADIDECVLGTANCSVNAACTNTEGSFLCSCRQGYSGDGISCTDIDECSTETDICSQVCINTPGSFICGCMEGFLLDTDGKSCRGVEIGLQETSYTIAESAGRAEICVQLSRNLTGNVTLVITSEAGTATASADYLIISEELQLSPSSSTLFCVDVPILEDDVVENTEYFSVLLNSSDSVANITTGFATVAITDNDNIEATFTEALYSVRETSGSVTVCVSMFGALERNVTLQLRTEDGRAKAPDDYININEGLIFSSGSNITMCVQITVLFDGIAEDTELFTVVLTTNDSSVIFTRGTTSVAIINSDVSVGILQELYLFEEDVGKAEVCVQLSEVLNDSVNVMLKSHEGTAKSGEDYTDINEVITFTQTTVMCVYISIVDDHLAELAESFSLQLSTTSPIITLRNCSATIIIVDNDAAVRLVNGAPLLSRTCECEHSFSVTILLERLRDDIRSINCRLASRIQGDCSDGSITFRNLPASRREPYILEVHAMLSDGRCILLTREIRLGGNGDCGVILINDGLVVNGDSVEVEWQGAGPTSSFDCRLDSNEFVPCESPFKAAGIINGDHRLKISPRGRNCKRRIPRKLYFTIFQSNITAPQTECISSVP